MMKKIGWFVVLTVLVFTPAVSFGALVLTDTSSGVPGTVYTLGITDLGSNNYQFSIDAATVDLTSTRDWYIDWLSLKTGIATAPTLTIKPSSDWLITIADVNNSNVNNNWPQNQRTGVYVDGIIAPNQTINEGALLDGSTYHWVFSVNLAGGLPSDFPFQVGYASINPANQKVSTTRLSQSFSVPEASAMMLLGMGLVGLVTWRRKKRFE